MSEYFTLRSRLLSEVKQQLWFVPDLAQQFECSERAIWDHFRRGLTSRMVNGKRASTPDEAEQYLRRCLAGDVAPLAGLRGELRDTD
jgi:hypothetical protein